MSSLWPDQLSLVPQLRHEQPGGDGRAEHGEPRRHHGAGGDPERRLRQLRQSTHVCPSVLQMSHLHGQTHRNTDHVMELLRQETVRGPRTSWCMTSTLSTRALLRPGRASRKLPDSRGIISTLLHAVHRVNSADDSSNKVTEDISHMFQKAASNSVTGRVQSQGSVSFSHCGCLTNM